MNIQKLKISQNKTSKEKFDEHLLEYQEKVQEIETENQSLREGKLKKLISLLHCFFRYYSFTSFCNLDRPESFYHRILSLLTILDC